MYTHEDAKSRAKKLREILANFGHEVTHSTALEIIAQQSEYKDWNTYSAALMRHENLLPPPRGWQLDGELRMHYDFGIDPSISRKGSHPAVLRYRNSSKDQPFAYAGMLQSFDASPYRSKRVKLSAEMMCEACDGRVALMLRADNASGGNVAFDNLEQRGNDDPNGPLTGDVDWCSRHIVLDIPDSAHKIVMGFYILGRGSAFCSGFSFDFVSGDVEPTIKQRDLLRRPENLALT